LRGDARFGDDGIGHRKGILPVLGRRELEKPGWRKRQGVVGFARRHD
jgi:hypothetical protein